MTPNLSLIPPNNRLSDNKAISTCLVVLEEGDGVPVLLEAVLGLLLEGVLTESLKKS